MGRGVGDEAGDVVRDAAGAVAGQPAAFEGDDLQVAVAAARRRRRARDGGGDSARR